MTSIVAWQLLIVVSSHCSTKSSICPTSNTLVCTTLACMTEGRLPIYDIKYPGCRGCDRAAQQLWP